MTDRYEVLEGLKELEDLYKVASIPNLLKRIELKLYIINQLLDTAKDEYKEMENLQKYIEQLQQMEVVFEDLRTKDKEFLKNKYLKK